MSHTQANIITICFFILSRNNPKLWANPMKSLVDWSMKPKFKMSPPPASPTGGKGKGRWVLINEPRHLIFIRCRGRRASTYFADQIKIAKINPEHPDNLGQNVLFKVNNAQIYGLLPQFSWKQHAFFTFNRCPECKFEARICKIARLKHLYNFKGTLTKVYCSDKD